jgi:hypothetical protein
MGKKVKKALNIATFGLSGAAERLAVDPLKAALGATSSALGAGADTGSTAATVETTSSTPTAVSADTEAAREAQRRRQLAAAGLSGNVLTGASGLGNAPTTGAKSLLGS